MCEIGPGSSTAARKEGRIFMDTKHNMSTALPSTGAHKFDVEQTEHERINKKQTLAHGAALRLRTKSLGCLINYSSETRRRRGA